MTSPLDDIERHLGELQPERRFATHFKRSAGDLRLEVDGLGGVPLPVDALVARELCAHAELARHGYRDETRLDTRVRNTWEIPAAKLRIDEARWRRTLDPALARIHDELDLADTMPVRATRATCMPRWKNCARRCWQYWARRTAPASTRATCR